MALTQVQGGMILASGQSIPKAALPTGSVLQVVQATTSTTVSVTTSSYTDTGLTASITPTSSSSKILVLVNQSIVISGSTGSQYGGMKLLRGATSILDPVESGGAPYDFGFATYGNQGMYNRLSINYLDSPATTSATIYKTQGRPYNSTTAGTMAFQVGGSPNGTSTIILMEIAA
jgi:hypothetical protein